ncbi:MAG: hypothetical protein F6K63_10730 [Moorea sp. SIO1G6]|uniref:Uncharacterized protein n=1 Tax=Moorena producens (strain JHB) TaxID=1454205 RepID=A0A1D9G795_MOOP1|nr:MULTISPECIES: hypothetical protein [Moorena]AOY83517.1 hypothetical protein BJP36_29975 [Moorena producens JHB]NET64834.1 hypothetical protein [Moorena sp. SIO1G6]
MTRETIQFILQILSIALAALASFFDSVYAQPITPQCQPPHNGEYILLVLSRTRKNHEQIQRILPKTAKTNFCQYLEDIVTRVGGFRGINDAKDWARYLDQVVGYSAFVVQSPPSSQPTTRQPNTRQPTTIPGYTPQGLGDGYAVLVDYFNQPEVASRLEQLLGVNVGLVSYAQRPYLLTVHTTSETQANSILRRLSAAGFWAMVVDSRRVTLLKRKVVRF